MPVPAVPERGLPVEGREACAGAARPEVAHRVVNPRRALIT